MPTSLKRHMPSISKNKHYSYSLLRSEQEQARQEIVRVFNMAKKQDTLLSNVESGFYNRG
jgi:hypothetical protein